MINLEQRLVLINQCSNELFRIALDPHGTRSLQKLIDVIETNEEIEIITRNLYSNIVVLSRDLNGNHVVQKILTKFNTISSDSNSSDSTEMEPSIKTKINSFLILFKPIFYILLVIDMGVVYYRGVWIMGTNNNVNNYHKRLPSILSNYLWIHMVITLYSMF